MLLNSWHSKSSVAVTNGKGVDQSVPRWAAGQGPSLIRSQMSFLATIRQPANQTMFRLSSLLCAALLISAPVFADSCSRHKDAPSDNTEQKKEVQS